MPETTSSWQPLLTGAEAQRAEQAIAHLAAGIRQLNAQPQMTPLRAHGVGGGPAGQALFWAYLAHCRHDEAAADEAVACLDRASELLAESVAMPALYGGFCGTAWVNQHLTGLLFEAEEGEEGEEDSHAEIDQALLSFLDHRPWHHDYDLISGLVGFGVYGLERWPRPAATAILERVVAQLADLAQPRPPGLSWHTSPSLLPKFQSDLYPEGYYNLGLAHGVPGVIALLGSICQLGVAAARSRELAEGAMAWLLAQRRDGGTWTYPTVVASGAAPSGSRLAWCYGDLGIAVALLHAARCLQRSDWEAEAIRVGQMAARRPEADTGVRDAGLCHGSVGNAHIFNRMFQATGEPTFADAARHWYRYTLDYRTGAPWLSGFPSWEPTTDREVELREVPGFLTGVAGVGLGLLAAITDLEPSWDRLLLTAVAPRR